MGCRQRVDVDDERMEPTWRESIANARWHAAHHQRLLTASAWLFSIFFIVGMAMWNLPSIVGSLLFVFYGHEHRRSRNIYLERLRRWGAL